MASAVIYKPNGTNTILQTQLILFRVNQNPFIDDRIMIIILNISLSAICSDRSHSPHYKVGFLFPLRYISLEFCWLV